MIRIPDLGPLRAAPRWTARPTPICRQAGAAGGRPRRHQEQDRPGQAPRHQHVRGAPQRRTRQAQRQAAAAQPARRPAPDREVGPAARRLGDETVDAYIKMKASGVERLRPPPDRVGARTPRSTADAAASPSSPGQALPWLRHGSLPRIKSGAGSLPVGARGFRLKSWDRSRFSDAATSTPRAPLPLAGEGGAHRNAVGG